MNEQWTSVYPHGSMAGGVLSPPVLGPEVCSMKGLKKRENKIKHLNKNQEIWKKK